MSVLFGVSVELLGDMAVKVLDGVFLGDAESSFDPDFLDMNKISNLINLSGRETANAYASHGLVYLSYTWEDNEFFALYDPRELGVYGSGKDISIRVPTPFHEIGEFIDTSLRYGISVLLFSQDGGGRTAAAMCAYLMLKYGWSHNKALELIMSKKPNAMPNRGYLNQLEALDKHLLKERGYLKERHLNTEDLSHPKVEGNGAIIYDMVADFPPMAFSRWNNFKLDYLEAEKAMLEAKETSVEKKKVSKKTRMDAKEEADDDDYDHKSPAMRDCENEMVVIVSHVNTKRIQPAPSEMMALDKPRSKGRRLKFKEKLVIQLGPETSENDNLAALRGGRGRGRVGRTTPFGDIGGGGSSSSSSVGGLMSINGTGLGSGSGGREGPLGGGDSLDMSSIDGSDSSLRSSMRGSRKSGRKNPIDLASLVPYQSLETPSFQTRGGGGAPRLNAGGGGGGGGGGGADEEARRGKRGEEPTSYASSTTLSAAADTVGSSSSGDLYEFVGMDSDHSGPSRVADAKYRVSQASARSGTVGITSPGRQVEQELEKVTAFMSESDRRVHESKTGVGAGSGEESRGGRRRLVNRASQGGGHTRRAEDKRSAHAETDEAKGYESRNVAIGAEEYGEERFEQLSVGDVADAKQVSSRDGAASAESDSGMKLSLHDLAHRPIYDTSSNMHTTASPSSLSPAARENERMRKEAASDSWDGHGDRGRGQEAKLSLEMLASAGPGAGAFAHSVNSTTGRPSKHHAYKSGAVSGSPASHDRTRDLSTSKHGRGQFRDVSDERAAGMRDEDRGVSRDKVRLHAPPSLSAVHGVVIDDPLAAFDPCGGDFMLSGGGGGGAGRGGSPLRSSQEQIIPMKYPLDRTRPTSASIANANAMSETRTGRPGSGRKPLGGAAAESGPYRSPYSGTARPGSATIQRPGSAKATRAVPGAGAGAGAGSGSREIGTFGTSVRPGSAKAPNSRSSKSAGGGSGYASVYLKGAAKSPAPHPGSAGAGAVKRQGSIGSLGESSHNSATNARGSANASANGGKGSRKLVRRGV